MKAQLTPAIPSIAANASLMPTGRIQYNPFTEQAAGPSFTQVLSNTMNDVNATIQAPGALMNDAATTGNTDIHHVMVAMAQADMAVQLSSSIATKVVQAYDRILQIQV